MLVAIRKGEGQGVHVYNTIEEFKQLLKKYPNCSYRLFSDDKHDAAVNWANGGKQKGKSITNTNEETNPNTKSHPFLDTLRVLQQKGYHFARIIMNNNNEHLIALCDMQGLILNREITVRSRYNGDANNINYYLDVSGSSWGNYSDTATRFLSKCQEFKDACENWNGNDISKKAVTSNRLSAMLNNNRPNVLYQPIRKTEVAMNGNFAILDGVLVGLNANDTIVELTGYRMNNYRLFGIDDKRKNSPVTINTNQISDIDVYKLPDEWNITDSMIMQCIHELEKQDCKSYALSID